jgi:2'-5' RNA ligase
MHPRGRHRSGPHRTVDDVGVRLFAAVVPPPEAIADLEDFLEPRRDVDGPRWTRSDQWHLTLAFMPAVPDRALEHLVERLEEATAARRSSRLALAGGGCFPDVTRARVLWCGVRYGERLEPLARAVRSAAAVSGAAPEGGPFRPHLTLARFGRPVEGTRWVRLLEGYAGPEWTAAEVVLVESHLPRERGHRPHHEVLARLPLHP